jgi:hypothetical protein
MAELGEYRKLQVPTFPARTLQETPEGRYWRGFRQPALLQQIAGVTFLDVCAAAPHHIAATSSTRVRPREAAWLEGAPWRVGSAVAGRSRQSCHRVAAAALLRLCVFLTRWRWRLGAAV